MPTKAPFKFMSEDEIKRAVKRGDDQCIVIAENSGTLCWYITDPENEKTYQIEKGDLLWCWNFVERDGEYFHDYANMAPTNVKITTDVKLRLVYVSDTPDEDVHFKTTIDKGPNWA